MKVVLWGYYGSNYGDNIMLETLLDYFYEKKIRVELVDLYNRNFKYQYENQYSNVKVVTYNELTRFEKLMKLIEFSKAKINLWGGGTIFTDADGDGNYKEFTRVKFLGGRIGYVGVGIGDLTIKERINKTQKLLKKSDFLIFRDENSYNRANKLAKKNYYYLVEDLAYVHFNNVLQNIKNYEAAKYNNYILISWRNLVRYMSADYEEKLMDSIIDCISLIFDKYGCDKVILSALDTKYDVESCETLKFKLKNKGVSVIFDKDSSIHNITSLIYNSSFHLSGRLHGSIASEVLNVPTLSLAYSPKIIYFYESINSKNYIDIYEDNMNIMNSIIDLKDIKTRQLDFQEKYKDSLLNLEYLNDFIG